MNSVTECVLLGGSTVTTTVKISEIVNKEVIRQYVAKVGGIIQITPLGNRHSLKLYHSLTINR